MIKKNINKYHTEYKFVFSDQLFCGAGKCIAVEHICNGVSDCEWGQDERNCGTYYNYLKQIYFQLKNKFLTWKFTQLLIHTFQHIKY